MKSRAGIYNPYWDTAGGGEKYAASVARLLLKLGYEVDIFWYDPNLPAQMKERFDIEMAQVHVIQEGYRLLTTPGPLTRKWAWERAYDLLFFVSDGSIPILFGRHNILHFQVPFTAVNGASLTNRLKFGTIKDVVCNSRFTQAIIDREYGIRSRVIYPPVATIPERTKEKMILSVGRFDNGLHSKRHDILIEAYTQLADSDWTLVLAGGALHGTQEVQTLRQKMGNYQVNVVVNPDFNTLKKLYGRATVYWHAAGYGQDLRHHPERAEHFGISTVEAMSAGAIPVTFAGGGQKEIVQPGVNGFLWSTVEELVETTRTLIHSKDRLPQLQAAAKTRAGQFNEEVFEHELLNLIG